MQTLTTTDTAKQQAEARREVGLSPAVDDALTYATLDSIRAALKIDLDSSEAPGEDWPHPLFGKVRIGPMSYEGTRRIEAVEIYAPVQGKLQNISAKQKDIRAKDEVYLQFGVLNPQLTPEIVKEILDAPVHGAATRELLSAIKRWNPTYEEQADSIKLALAGSRFALVLWRVFREAGALPELAKALSLKDDTVEALLRCSVAFDTLLEIEESARVLSVPIEQAALREAGQAALRMTEAA